MIRRNFRIHKFRKKNFLIMGQNFRSIIFERVSLDLSIIQKFSVTLIVICYSVNTNIMYANSIMLLICVVFVTICCLIYKFSDIYVAWSTENSGFRNFKRKIFLIMGQNFRSIIFERGWHSVSVNFGYSNITMRSIE